MAKKPRSVPFEQIAQQVAGAPSVSAPFDLRAPGGRGYRLLENNVSPERVRDIGRDGVPLGWDACGCGGDCGYRWYSAEQVSRAAAAATPESGRSGRLVGRFVLLRSDEGDSLLLAHHPARWGTLLE
ncbi:hypothetical protein LWF15_02455 [Kineosporia rhizophila]|uniref:hypothetical protein n=1 Tax=Kineosporia rhizophila TaxID=84633 RepID=UPI001E54385D|nr:hypothetical protein [Kineosporia rhizophila]MCE0534361.1 hypothetical protein [Kineosporia rhizophila]